MEQKRPADDPSSPPEATVSSDRLDLRALTAWMEANVAGFRGPLEIEKFSNGQSNPTYRITTASKDYVLRRKPAGLLVKGAHAIEREVRVLSALASTPVPVPHVHGVCIDNAVLGTPFYVMDMVQGRIFWDITLPNETKSDRACIFDAMNDTISKIHSVDYRASGLTDFGRPENYFSRQIDRWSSQYLQETDAGRDANFDRLIEWIRHHVPKHDDVTTLIHGDFRIDNMIFAPDEPKIIAVLDWELSTLGHPGADFGYHAMMYRMPPHLVAGLYGVDIASLGIPSEEEYISSYRRRTQDITNLENYEFYITFNLFRLCAILHGIKGRLIRGTASSPDAAERVKILPDLAELGWKQAQLCGVP